MDRASEREREKEGDFENKPKLHKYWIFTYILAKVNPNTNMRRPLVFF